VRFLDNADEHVALAIAGIADDDLADVIQNLGVLIDAFRQCDADQDRPSVVFAYTIKGYGLPIVGDPLNHSALLSRSQIDDLRKATGLTEADEWGRFPDESPAGQVCLRVGGEVNNVPVPPRPVIVVPEHSGATHKPHSSSQEAFGRVLVAYGRDPALGPRRPSQRHRMYPSRQASADGSTRAGSIRHRTTRTISRRGAC
jgi:pyruvate dehydrogenase E1 component